MSPCGERQRLISITLSEPWVGRIGCRRWDHEHFHRKKFDMRESMAAPHYEFAERIKESLILTSTHVRNINAIHPHEMRHSLNISEIAISKGTPCPLLTIRLFQHSVVSQQTSEYHFSWNCNHCVFHLQIRSPTCGETHPPLIRELPLMQLNFPSSRHRTRLSR